MDLSSVTAFVFAISIDWIVLAGVFVLALLDSMRGGSARAVALALALPSAYLILSFVSTAQFMGDISKQFSSDLAQALFAAIILALCFFLLYRITDTFIGEGGFIQALTAALGLCVMLALFWQLIPAFTALHPVNAQVQAVFSEAYRFWWLIGAFVALALSRA